jgi:hypothetical protein
VTDRPGLARVMHLTREVQPNGYGHPVCNQPGPRANVTTDGALVTCKWCVRIAVLPHPRPPRRGSETRCRTVPVAFRLLPAERDRLSAEARRRDVSLAELIRSSALAAVQPDQTGASRPGNRSCPRCSGQNPNICLCLEDCGHGDCAASGMPGGAAGPESGRLAEAVRLLGEVLHLQMHGERAPGGNETWADLDLRLETFLRSLSEEER